MKRFLKNNFSLIMYIFLALYVILLRYNIESSVILYIVGLMIGAIFVAVVPFFVNNCKKIETRRAYLASFVALSIYLLLIAVTYFFKNNHPVYTWIIRISMAASIATMIFQLFYTVKDWFKKDYTFEKFDLQAIKMLINSVTYFLIIYALTSANVGAPTFPFDPIDLTSTISFEFKPVATWMFYISVGYFICYGVIETILYLKYTRHEPKD